MERAMRIIPSAEVFPLLRTLRRTNRTTNRIAPPRKWRLRCNGRHSRYRRHQRNATTPPRRDARRGWGWAGEKRSRERRCLESNSVAFSSPGVHAWDGGLPPPGASLGFTWFPLCPFLSSMARSIGRWCAPRCLRWRSCARPCRASRLPCRSRGRRSATPA